MNSPSALSFPTKIFTGRLLVQKRKIIHPSLFLSHAIISTNQSCCGAEEKKRVELVPREVRQVVKLRESAISKPDEFIIEVPKARAAPEVLPQEKVPLFYEILSNAWPVPSERVENLTITQKRCQFSNEAVSIKPITAIPGIGKTYGQALADQGFVYARQLLGYYLMLKDSEMFRKWLEYKFDIPKFRAAEITSALNELIRRTL